MAQNQKARKQRKRPRKNPESPSFAASLYRASDWNRIVEPAVRPGVGQEAYRSAARRDYARLIHCPAFRRLQGKTQLFPGWESDFFRNRLTHSIEVAQISESLAYKINHEVACFASSPLDERVAAFAGLAHDLGHPPFGHNGEKALDDCMKVIGGFEGNAQTLRILCRLEKKETDSDELINSDGEDKRVGLNLSLRCLASILKYDRKIPIRRKKSDPLVKGYYSSEANVVKRIKEAVSVKHGAKPFKTIECHIMDLADDIAYSTYDLEDSFKAGFLNPLEIVGSSDELLDRVAEKVSDKFSRKIGKREVLEVLLDIFSDAIIPQNEYTPSDVSSPNGAVLLATNALASSNRYARDGRLRTNLTSDLISLFISGVQVEPNIDNPPLSVARFNDETLLKVEILKNFTYEATIMSPRLKVAEHRG